MDKNTPFGYSHLFNLETLGEKPKLFHIVPDSAARAALAARFGLLSIDRLVAELVVERVGGRELVAVQGKIEAEIAQSCVISGVPVAARVDEAVSDRFGQMVEEVGEVEFSVDDVDPPEAIIDDAIDLGELIAQYIGVAIEPYPRAPGAEIPSQYQIDEGEVAETVRNPFSALANLDKSRN